MDTPVDRVETLTEPPDEPASPVASQLNPPPANSTGTGGQQPHGPGTPTTNPPKDDPPTTNPPPDDDPPTTTPPKDDPPTTNPPPDDDPPTTTPPKDDPPTSEPPPPDDDPPPSEPPPDDEPELTTVTGVLQQCDAGWCLDTTVLDLGPDDYVQQGQASQDYDADGAVETVTAELEGLAGTEVTLEVEMTDTAAVVYTIQGLVYRPTDGSPAPWETA